MMLFMKSVVKFNCTVEPRLSGPRLPGFLDYLDFFTGPKIYQVPVVTLGAQGVAFT